MRACLKRGARRERPEEWMMGDEEAGREGAQRELQPGTPRGALL